MYFFADSFDLYNAIGDAYAGYWDQPSATNFQISTTGRFGGRSIYSSWQGSAINVLNKASGNNDGVHHLLFAFMQSAALSGTTQGFVFQFIDGAATQCSIVMRSDGAMQLYSGAQNGTLLDTFTGVIPIINQWVAIEVEVVISNTAGGWRIRIGGSATDSHVLTGVNTRAGSTNNYANKLGLGLGGGVNYQYMDDFIWRSDPASVPFLGDIRSYIRSPNSDQQAQFSRSVNFAPVNTYTPFGNHQNNPAGQAGYIQFVSGNTGIISTISLLNNTATGGTGHCKCAIFADNGSNQPGLVLGTSNEITNPGGGNIVFTFTPGVPVTQNGKYWLAMNQDATMNVETVGYGTNFYLNTPYASWPVSNPNVTTGGNMLCFQYTISANANWQAVCEIPEDGATSYVLDNVVGHADFYGVTSIPVTPAAVIAVVTRGFLQKSDAGSRYGAVQMKSGGVTVSSGSQFIPTIWWWLWRNDLVDPATGAAWTPIGVNNAQLGPTVTA
jgi:hypothetical protein